MRLTKEQIRIITKVVSRIAGEKAEVSLFGSRVNDQAKGGDVDMFIEVDQRLSRLDRGRIKMELEQALGLPVDILVHVRDTELTPFQTIAHAHATPLAVRP
jgi:predicted nucleotidyltransferase